LTYYLSYCKLTLAREYRLVKLLSTLIFPKKSPLAVKIQSYLSERLLIKLILRLKFILPMNETEICKQIVLSAFHHRTLPNYGLIDNFDKKEIILRAAIWKAAGYHIEDTTTRH
jgi:hypothetical protein